MMCVAARSSPILMRLHHIRSQRMETDVLAFRDEMERAYSLRCDAATLTECSESNFNDCSSTYPGQQCMQADELVISRCGDGTACNGKRESRLL